MKSILAFMVGIGLVLTASADAAAAAAAGVDLNVAYCESTGAQYIDTGILGNPGLRVEAEIMWLENVTPEDDCHIIASFDKIYDGTIRFPSPQLCVRSSALLDTFTTKRSNTSQARNTVSSRSSAPRRKA